MVYYLIDSRVCTYLNLSREFVCFTPLIFGLDTPVVKSPSRVPRGVKREVNHFFYHVKIRKRAASAYENTPILATERV